MATAATECAHCRTTITDPTTQVVHGDKTYCCANCAAAMEQSGSGSDRQTRSHAEDLRCAHCGVAIVEESTMQSRADQAYCCANCLDAIDNEGEDTSSGHRGGELPAADRARLMR
jgi:hypothetical protein